MASLNLPKILIVDDEPEIHGIVADILTGICAVEGFTAGETAIEAARHEIFPAAIVDLRMASMQGVEVLTRLKGVCPYTQVIILTGDACKDSAIAAVNQGAFRYLIKPFRREPLRQSVSEALAAFESALLSHERLSLTSEHLQSVGLTPRLADVAKGILDGQTNEEIAKNLKIAGRTVEKHIERLLSHFGIPSRFLLESRLMKLLRRGGGRKPSL